MHYVGNDVIDPGKSSSNGGVIDQTTTVTGIGTTATTPPTTTTTPTTPTTTPGAPVTPTLSPTTSSSQAPSHTGLPDKPEYNWYYFDNATRGQFQFEVGKNYFITIRSKKGFTYAVVDRVNGNGFGGYGQVGGTGAISITADKQLAFAYSDDTAATTVFPNPTFEASTNPGYADPNVPGDWTRGVHVAKTAAAWEEVGQVFTAPADPLNPSATNRDLGLLQLGIGDVSTSGASVSISSVYNTPTIEFGAYGGAVSPSRAIRDVPTTQTITASATGPAADGKPHVEPYVKNQMCFVVMENVNIPGQALNQFAYWNGEIFQVGDDSSEFRKAGAEHVADQETNGLFVYRYYTLERTYAYDQGSGGSLNIAGRGPVRNVYSKTHLLAMRLIANDFISAAGQTRISARVNRKINSVQPGHAFGFNNNPASIVYDMMTDATYGAGLTGAALETPLLEKLHTHWGGDVTERGFNATFSGESTIAESLNTVAQITGSNAIAVGPKVSIAPDIAQTIRRQVFNENNILSESLSITYDFESDHQRDGIVVEYKDPVKGRDRSVKYPSTSINPVFSPLFGCTSETLATEYARLVENRRGMQRVLVKFETELEGLLCRVGDRIFVQNSFASWGDSARVASVNGTGPFTITLENPIQWAGATSMQALFRSPTGLASKEVVASRLSDNSFKIGVDPGQTAAGLPSVFEWNTTNDPIMVVLGPTAQFGRDFIVQEINVSGTICEITAIFYDPKVYAQTMYYQTNPLN